MIHEEIQEFVANRLASMLFREACSLVANDVVNVKDVDVIVEASMGHRWAITGPFESYKFAGGKAGLPVFLRNLAGTLKSTWQSEGKLKLPETKHIDQDLTPEDENGGGGSGRKKDWAGKVIEQTLCAYD